MYTLSPVAGAAANPVHAEPLPGEEVGDIGRGFAAAAAASSKTRPSVAAALLLSDAAGMEQQHSRQQQQQKTGRRAYGPEEEEVCTTEEKEEGDLLSYLERRPVKREEEVEGHHQRETPTQQQQQQQQRRAPLLLRLLASASLDSTEFQSLWEKVEGSSSTSSFNYKVTAAASSVLAHVGCDSAAADALGSAMEAAAAAKRIFTMASGVVDNILKLFLYAEDINGVLYLCEVQLDLLEQEEEELRLTVKSVVKQETVADEVSVLSAAELQQQAASRQDFATEVQDAVVDQLLKHQHVRGKHSSSPGLAVI